MSAYLVRLTPRARKQLRALDQQIRRRIQSILLELEHDPWPSGVKRIIETPLYRVRMGDWRVLYEVFEEEVIIMVVQIGHRREVYRKLTGVKQTSSG